ncbi:hypothetical protein KUCAC02_031680 [Chaenocephalus aceratus]|nr:hypothetical protein KUCAC02_031680 [Chaenocephalus aceratus]
MTNCPRSKRIGTIALRAPVTTRTHRAVALADRRQRRSMSPPFGRRLGECCREETGQLGFCPSAGEPSREQRGTDVAVSECFLEETRLTVTQVIGSPPAEPDAAWRSPVVCTPPHVGQAALRRVGEGVRLVSQEAAECGDDSRDDPHTTGERNAAVQQHRPGHKAGL